jgi:diguanylate cyclase (GGDEF)-like protein/PAS domain S-box-containing protein
MEKTSVRAVLLVEGVSTPTSPTRTMFEELGSAPFRVAHVDSIDDAEKYLVDNSLDIILLDLCPTGVDGLDVVRRLQIIVPDVPIVLLCEAEDESIAAQAIQEGAQDYLIKGQIDAGELKRALLNASKRKIIEGIKSIEKERAQFTLDSIGDAVICTDTSGTITFLNPVAERMTGWRRENATGQKMADCVRIVDGTTRKTILDPMAKAAFQNRAGSLPSNCVLIGRDGHEINIEDSVAPLRDRKGIVTGAVIVFRDVSATRALERELTDSAQHDFLTGLPNRLLLNDRISQAISLAHRQRCHAAVLFLDLDRFKHINDSLGHLIGDKVLQSVAKRLLECVRSPDTVVRQGGDEFIVVLQELKHPQDAIFTVARLLKTVAEVHSIDSHKIRITTSIGVSIYPDNGVDAETLVKNADIAMYYAKKNGNQTYGFFRPEMTWEDVEIRSYGQEIWQRSGPV